MIAELLGVTSRGFMERWPRDKVMFQVLFLLDKKHVPRRQACDDIPHKHASQYHGPIARTTGITSSHYAVRGKPLLASSLSFHDIQRYRLAQQSLSKEIRHADADNAQRESDQSPLFLEAE